MKAKEINEALELTQTLLSQWMKYRQYYEKGISDDPVELDEETEFLETTSSIAQNVRKLGERVNEKQFPFNKDRISALIKRTVSIQYFRNLPEADQKGFYKEWHESVILLSRTVGALKFISEGYVPPESKTKGKKSKKKKGGGGGTILIVLVILAVLGGIGGLLYFLGFI